MRRMNRLMLSSYYLIGLFLYHIGISLYMLGIFLLSFFHTKAALFLRGRKNIFQKLIQDFKEIKKPIIWIHTASLGEFEQGRPLIEKIKICFPQFTILLTFFSPSGYELMKNYLQADKIYYLPIDSFYNAKKFIDITSPKFTIFIKYEFWHFYIARLKKLNIPIISVSSIFRRKQIYFKSYGIFYRKILKNISHFFVQNQESAQLLKKANITKISIVGDTRFDRVVNILKNQKNIPIIEKFIRNHQTLIIGSSWQSDISFNAKVIQQLAIPLKIIIAPHEITNRNIEYIQKSFYTKKSILFSQSKDAKADIEQSDILIIDNIGMLSSLYRYADVAFIGGGFYKKGLHNILEAAIYGIPVVFGKHYQNFQEAKTLVQLGGAFPVDKLKKWSFLLEKLMREKDFRKKSGSICHRYVISNTGSTDKIIEYLKGNL